MQSEALMKTPSCTNLQIYRLLKPSNFQINPNISLQVEFGVSWIVFLTEMHIFQRKLRTLYFSEILSSFFWLCRVFLNQLAWLELDTPLKRNLVNSFAVLVFLRQKFWVRSTCCYFLSSFKLLSYLIII